MTLETDGTPGPGSAFAPAVQPETVPDPEQVQVDDTGEPEPEPELIDWEDGGKKYKVPAPLKDSLLRQKDYTQKTQTVSERQRQLDEREKSLTSWRDTEAAQQRNLGALALVDHQLSQFTQGQNGQMIGAHQVDWVAWQAQNPQEAQKALLRAQALQQQRQGLAAQVDEGKRKHEADSNAKIAQRIQATRDFAQKEIPGWTPDLDAELTEYAIREGLAHDVDDILRQLSPAFYKMVWQSRNWAAAQVERAKAAKAEAESVVTPLQTVGSRSGGPAPSRKPLSKIDNMDEYVAARKAGRKS